jgi:hypothetical protein
VIRALSLALALSLAAHASAQGETTTLPSGWSATTRLRRLTDVNAVACDDTHAYARGWGGGVAAFDGTSWTELPAIPGYDQGHTYGTQIAGTAHGVIVEASGSVASWDGSTWTVVTRPGTSPYDPLGGIAEIAGAIYAVGRGHVDRSAGAPTFTAHDAGTWRELSAIAGTSASDVWTAGQGGTLMHWDGHAWARTASGTDHWLGGLAVVSTSDVWAWSLARNYRPTPTLLHWDGHAWSSVAPPAQDVLALAVRGAHVWAATPDGVVERDGATWRSILSTADFGDTNHTFAGVCATRTHLVVGAGLGTVVTRPI